MSVPVIILKGNTKNRMHVCKGCLKKREDSSLKKKIIFSVGQIQK